MITIVDYGAGNIGSVEKAFQYLGQQVRLATTAKEVEEAAVLVLPGVGAIGDAMENLTKGGLAEAVVAHIKQNKPFLGICLGLQMLFEESEEGGLVKGLGVFPGKVCKFSETMGLKIPQIGWNQLMMKEDSRLFKGIPANADAYFVHSYYLKAENPGLVAARCDYGILFDAAIEQGNIFATQFHPEKSGTVGLQILKNFVEVAEQ